ncbi:Pre protein translocase subunit Sec66-domain-containing protein [Irpex rosettiformis]|uniref:Pre protein translocase subunit Sec66-domain-containing protein n=1 Tax=Irpex rosettiformis TaxID=378272 RepID=A0ACB8UI16_9APHY|nr:Pre protein translocase subunit Sec66-domain-containing protein [Irpex rosettiformis]
MASIVVPLLYVFIVFGGLWVFSTLYKRHLQSKAIEPYFGRHHERDVYTSLLLKTDPPAPESLLKAALMRRAVTDVHRIMRLREDKPALQNLLQKGSIGDELWNSLLAAERELEAEILETAAEANTFVEGWGQLIFQTATELYNTEKLRNVVESMDAIRAEKEQRYGVKSLRRVVAQNGPSVGPAAPVAVPINSLPGVAPTPAPAPPAPASPAPTPAQPATPNSAVPATSAPAPPSPSASATHVSSTKAESVVSSDGETPASPRTPSKSSKKNKKRK